MEDKYLTLQTTPTGMSMVIRSLYGDKISFTRIAVGDGTPADLNDVSQLANQRLSIGIKKADAKEDYLLLTGDVSSADVEKSFYGYELGVYAKGADGVERLYAYRYSRYDVDYYPASDSGRTLELTMSIVVQLGNAKNVTAVLIEGDAYAKADHKHDTADLITGVLPIARGGTGSETVYGSEMTKVRAVAIPASDWSYSVPYTQTVKVDGMTPECSPVISCGLPDSVTAAAIKAMRKAYGLIDRAISGNGAITFYCYRDRPKTDINAYAKGV